MVWRDQVADHREGKHTSGRDDGSRGCGERGAKPRSRHGGNVAGALYQPAALQPSGPDRRPCSSIFDRAACSPNRLTSLLPVYALFLQNLPTRLERVAHAPTVPSHPNLTK
jgi:hypothetical protein